MTYEDLLIETDDHNLITKEKNLPISKGRIKGNRIAIKKDIPTSAEKVCILAEELGHYYTTCGDILDQGKTINRKQEKIARNWAYKKLVPLHNLIAAYEAGARSRHELAEYLEVIEEFLEEAIIYYKEKYGLFVRQGVYTIYFEPLGVFRKI